MNSQSTNQFGKAVKTTHNWKGFTPDLANHDEYINLDGNQYTGIIPK